MIPATTPAAAAKGTLSLEQWLEHHPEALGRVLAEKRAVGQPTGRLPFLMKVKTARVYITCACLLGLVLSGPTTPCQGVLQCAAGQGVRHSVQAALCGTMRKLDQWTVFPL